MTNLYKQCSADQVHYFRSHGDDRNAVWSRMRLPCQIRTWVRHKFRRTKRRFSSKQINVGDSVYDKTNKTNFGKVDSVDEKDVHVSSYNHLERETTRSTIPIPNAVKMTEEQQKYLKDIDFYKKLATGQRAGKKSRKRKIFVKIKD